MSQQVTNRNTVQKKPTPKYILGFSTVNESPKTSAVTTSNETSKKSLTSLGGHGAVTVKDSLNKPMIKEVDTFL